MLNVRIGSPRGRIGVNAVRLDSSDERGAVRQLRCGADAARVGDRADQGEAGEEREGRPARVQSGARQRVSSRGHVFLCDGGGVWVLRKTPRRGHRQAQPTRASPTTALVNKD